MDDLSNAVEKVARVVAAVGYATSNVEWLWPDCVPEAEALIAVFPQLALEGREEWGSAYNADDVMSRATGLSREAALDHAERFDVVALTRTVWEQPWSVVEDASVQS